MYSLIVIILNLYCIISMFIDLSSYFLLFYEKVFALLYVALKERYNDLILTNRY